MTVFQKMAKLAEVLRKHGYDPNPLLGQKRSGLWYDQNLQPILDVQEHFRLDSLCRDGKKPV